MDFELTEAQKKLQEKARRFARDVIIPMEQAHPEPDWGVDLIKELLKKMDDAGLSKTRVPKEYGGQGMGFLDDMIMKIELRKTYKSRWLMGLYSRDPMPIMYSGTEYQKNRYLYPVLKREKTYAFGFTEPGAGSDVKGIATTATKEGDHYILNGSKIFPSYAHLADFTFICAYTDKSQGHRGMSMFYVDRGTPGFTVERILKTFDRNDVEPLIKLENCKVPAENIVGQGKGFSVGMTQFNATRLLIGSGALAKCEMSLEMAIDYARKRNAFDRPIGRFQTVQNMLVDAKVGVETMRWLVYNTAWKFDRGDDIRLDAAMVKFYCVETGLRVLDECMQVFGGIGLTDMYPFYDFYSNLRLQKSAEGSIQILQHIMATELLGREITAFR